MTTKGPIPRWTPATCAELCISEIAFSKPQNGYAWGTPSSVTTNGGETWLPERADSITIAPPSPISWSTSWRTAGTTIVASRTPSGVAGPHEVRLPVLSQTETCDVLSPVKGERPDIAKRRLQLA